MTRNSKIICLLFVLAMLAYGASIALGGEDRVGHFNSVELIDSDDDVLTVEPSSSMTSGYTFTFPPDDGTSNYVMRGDGSGGTTWVDAISTLHVADVSHDGYLSSADWSTFNSKASSPVDLTTGVTGTLPVANGGTGLSTGTSGGVLAYTADGVLAASAALTANAVVVGGGAGVVPTVVANNGTATNKFLTQSSSGAPAWSVIADADVPNLSSKTLTTTSLTGLTTVLAGNEIQFNDDNNSNHARVGAPSNLTTDIDITFQDSLSGSFALTANKLSAFAATSSSELFGVLSDETGGSGVVVGSVSPVVTTPTVRTSLLLQNATGSQPELQLSEDPDNGTNKTTIKAAASQGDWTMTLPATDGSTNQSLCDTDGSGTMGWCSPFTNPMTNTGDIVYSSDNSGTPARLGIGSATTLLHGGTTPSYSAVVTGDITDGTIVNADISGSAAIDGSKVTAASSSAAGTITREVTGSFTATFFETTGPATDTWYYARSGNVVTLQMGANIKQFTKSVQSDTVLITGAPAAILPSTTVNCSQAMVSYNDAGSPTAYPSVSFRASTSGFILYRSNAQDAFNNGSQNAIQANTIVCVLR